MDMNSMNTIKELAEERAAAVKKLNEEIREKAKETMQVLFDEFFSEYPMTHEVRWTQYTPYFNDGDPCVFGASEPSFVLDIDIENEDYDEYDLYDCSKYMLEPSNHTIERAKEGSKWSQEVIDDWNKSIELYGEEKCKAFARDFSAICQFLSAIEGDLEHLFGDGVLVRVTKDGVDVEDYDHD
jgi:hypothetical protein